MTIQQYRDRLEEAKEKLPSLKDLERKLREKRQAMDRAIASKDFAAADELDSAVVVPEKLCGD